MSSRQKSMTEDSAIDSADESRAADSGISVPVIDLTRALAGDRAARLQAAREIDRACTEIGFFSITGHGVDTAVIEQLRDRASRFFNQSLADKLKAQPDDPGVPRGYRAIGFESLAADKGAAPPDLKEYYHFGRESWPDEPYYTSAEGQRYFIANKWPAYPRGFAEAAEAYYLALETLSEKVLSLAALGLGIDENFFNDKIDRHITAIRINFYPEQDQAPAEGQLRAGEHTDYGLLTILNAEDKPGGLEVLTRTGVWVPVRANPDAFVINIGDLLMRWSNDRWLSNVHRVVNPPPDTGPVSQRISIGFFHHPNYDAEVRCIAAPGEEKHAPVLSGDYRDMKYQVTRT